MRLTGLLRRSIERRQRGLLCRDAVGPMAAYLEGALSAGDRTPFEAHLARCTACTAYLDQMRVSVAALGYLEPDEVPDTVLDELVELFRRFHAS